MYDDEKPTKNVYGFTETKRKRGLDGVKARHVRVQLVRAKRRRRQRS